MRRKNNSTGETIPSPKFIEQKAHTQITKYIHIQHKVKQDESTCYTLKTLQVNMKISLSFFQCIIYVYGNIFMRFTFSDALKM